jgi:hypothetical protein
MRELAIQFLALADKQRATGPLMMAHRIMGLSLLHTGDVVDGQANLERAMTLYDPAEHRSLATRFGQDIGAATSCWKSLASWLLGHPEAALADTECALKYASLPKDGARLTRSQRGNRRHHHLASRYRLFGASSREPGLSVARSDFGTID